MRRLLSCMFLVGLTLVGAHGIRATPVAALPRLASQHP
ncbi:MAG: hypothetical protein RLY87_447, partial [Chloroflexota bacterium]